LLLACLLLFLHYLSSFWLGLQFRLQICKGPTSGTRAGEETDRSGRACLVVIWDGRRSRISTTLKFRRMFSFKVVRWRVHQWSYVTAAQSFWEITNGLIFFRQLSPCCFSSFMLFPFVVESTSRFHWRLWRLDDVNVTDITIPRFSVIKYILLSILETIWLMLFREKMGVWCNVTAGSTYLNHWALKR